MAKFGAVGGVRSLATLDCGRTASPNCTASAGVTTHESIYEVRNAINENRSLPCGSLCCLSLLSDHDIEDCFCAICYSS